MSHFQTQLIPNQEHINDAPLASYHGLNGDLPIQETDNNVSLVHEQSSHPHLEEDFGGEIIELLEDFTGWIEVLLITVDSTPAIVDQLY